MSSSHRKVAVVTGSSSGIGYDACLVLARAGFRVFATMRNTSKGDAIMKVAEKERLPIQVAELDVTKAESVEQAVSKIVKEAGRIDVLVNNAGYGLGGAFEDSSMEEVKDQFETNVFGVIRVTQQVLPQMRKQKSGRIINISSGAGRLGYPAASIYVGTKHALEGISEALAYEVQQFGIRVSIIEPGVMKTNFANAMVFAKKAQDPSSPYAPMIQRMSGNWTAMMQTASPTEVVSDRILQAATAENPELRYLAGKDVEGWVQARKTMPESEFVAMIRQSMLG
jgi:NAD(P)-dependent dehydrogenase (short-subunit alcohol dehydrogenase family)